GPALGGGPGFGLRGPRGAGRRAGTASWFRLGRAPKRYARRMEIDRDEVLKALEQVIDPELRRPVTELDMVRDLELHDGVVALTIVLTVAGCPLRESFEQQVEQAFAGIA